MPASVFNKGAPNRVAPFAFWLLLTSIFLLAGNPRPATASACQALKTGERVQVVYVYDGDTVKLNDGRRLRLIGINTPEVGYKDQPNRPLADAARSALQRLLDTHNRILLLQYGKQDHDHYGRLLAHAFLENGDNVAVYLLQQGLATTLVVPPNSWAAECYQHIENEARLHRKGLWALPDYQSQAARTLPLSSRGFRIVQGQVNSIRTTRDTVWVDIEGPLVLQISKKDLVNFDSLEALIGQQVEVRGWVKQDRDGLRMKIQHPAALVAITGAPQQRY
ncbi:MAG: thermonuclease family protein [Gammaproteobacteria bacterium]|jgi:endonuclease YncB( thermonuclease family)